MKRLLLWRSIGVRHVLDAFHIYADGNIDGLVHHAAAIADFNPQGVEEDHRVELIELALLPDHDFLKDRIGDRGDGIRRDIHPQARGEVVLDVSDGHAAGCHKLTIMSQEVRQATAALRDHLRRIQTITISWNLNFQRAVI